MKKYMDRISLKKEKSDFLSVKIVNSKSAYNVVKQFYFEDIGIYESMFMLMLNTSLETTGYVKISQGGTAGTVVDPKIIAKYAIDSLASSVILVHNHPSGNLTSSEADKRMTRKIQDGLNLFDIKLCDHIIISSEGYRSMMDEGEVL